MKPPFIRLVALVACCLLPAFGCSDDEPKGTSRDVVADQSVDGADGTDVTGDAAADGDGVDVSEPVAPDEVFAFGLDPGQTVSLAPFPNNLYLGSDGLVALAPIATDPRLAAMATENAVTAIDETIATREGFGFTSPIWFFTNADLAPASLEGRVSLVTLAGPEAGTVIPVQTFANSRLGFIGVFPDWGSYMMAESTYGVLIERGVTTLDGMEVEAPADFAATIAAADPATPTAEMTAARQVFAPLRAWMAAESKAADAYVIGTIFTTEPTLPLAQQVFDAVDRFTLKAPTLRVRYDEAAAEWVSATPLEGAALDDVFGPPEAPYHNNPGIWSSGSRADAETLSGAPYAGGTMHGFGRVIHGTYAAPALNYRLVDGAPVNSAYLEDADGITWDTEALIPFSLFLCDEHLADPSNIPVAVFTHGGGALRVDAVAWANLNCLSGVATVAYDLPFHGGRTATVYLPGEGALAPAQPDEENRFTGLSAGDPGFVPDVIGDAGEKTDSLGGLYALTSGLDPRVMEPNFLAIAADTYTLVRLVEEGDWSQVQAGLSFDTGKLLHQSLSYGTSYTTVLMAARDNFRGILNSVGSGWMLMMNLPMAPSNATLASSIVSLVLKLSSTPAELMSSAYADPAIALLQWLSERGDPMAYAPYVLRHRPSGALPSVLSTGNSWDEALLAGAQMSYNNAYGFQVRTAGADYTIDPTVPGSQLPQTEAYGVDPIAGNVTFGGTSTTAVVTYLTRSCHGLVVTPTCKERWVTPYPPIVELDPHTVFESPICQVQAQAKVFIDSLLAGDAHGAVVAPSGTCADLYGP